MENTKNTAQSKAGIVADFLHGMITITPVERYICSTPAFNRLHDVKQNSTAFLTYPSMVHSRFGHSLGVLHLADQMYVSALANADDSDRDRFLHSINGTVNSLCRFGVVIQPNEKVFKNLSRSDLERFLLDGAKRSPLVKAAAPYGLTQEHLVTYCVALQALRIAALVHDLGHPPFSHVTEFAVEELAEQLAAQPAGRSDGRAGALLSVHDNAKQKGKPLHELLTLELFGDLCSMVGDTENVGGVFLTDADHLFARASMSMARAILQGGKFDESNVEVKPEAVLALRCLRSLEDGPLDADRIDYVQRDVLHSGIRDRGFRPERLISLLRLGYDKPTERELKENGQNLAGFDVPRVLPSIRSLHSLEEFYEWRSELYRTVIYHHHVVRTDGFFQALINKQCHGIIDGHSVDGAETRPLDGSSDSLQWLWKIYAVEAGAYRKMDMYLQWDDHWLMTVLRLSYLRLKTRASKPIGISDADSVELKRLEEIVASKKNYISLIKRYEHYKPVVASFMNCWATEVLKWRQHPDNAANVVADRAIDVIAKSMGTPGAQAASAAQADLVDLETIFSGVTEFVQVVSPDTSKTAVRKIVETAADSFKSEYKCLDLFWKHKPAKAAIASDFKIWTDSGPDLLTNHSNLINELALRGRRSPTYFFYVLPKESKSHVNPETARKLLGECLARATLAAILALPAPVQEEAP